MNPFLEHFANRLVDAPDFLACALAEYAQSEKLCDAELAGRLGCSTDMLTHLRICRMPRVHAPEFWRDIETIAARFSLDATVLAEVVRRGQTLLQLRRAQGGDNETTGYLLAARDDSRDEKSPPGANQ
jgi:hypothetical protein